MMHNLWKVFVVSLEQGRPPPDPYLCSVYASFIIGKDEMRDSLPSVNTESAQKKNEKRNTVSFPTLFLYTSQFLNNYKVFVLLSTF